jgi:1,2-diacylglycerol 3-beta-galactosyltransferase
MGSPLIISGFIPGQEEGNVAYVLKNNAGAYAETPAEIAQLAARWLEPENTTLPTMAANAARLARPQASLEIARQICGLIPRRETVYAAAAPSTPAPRVEITSPQWMS